MRRPPARQGANLLFPLSLGGPPLVWQLLFFVVPFGFLIAVTFWSVRNFRLTPDFITGNWVHIVGAGFFRGAYAYTFILAAMTAILASLIAFPAAYTLAFKVTPSTRRILIFLAGRAVFHQLPGANLFVASHFQPVRRDQQVPGPFFGWSGQHAQHAVGDDCRLPDAGVASGDPLANVLAE
jgi:hypothetical protein